MSLKGPVHLKAALVFSPSPFPLGKDSTALSQVKIRTRIVSLTKVLIACGTLKAEESSSEQLASHWSVLLVEW